MASVNRIVMNKSARRWIKALGPDTVDCCEISGKWGRNFGFRSYTACRFPEYDICSGPFTGDDGAPLQFDLIIANQVWEHLDRPYAATRNVLAMLKSGGHFFVAVPFYIPYHGAPIDCSRWSARGLKNLLIEGGFAEEGIRADQWGNRQAAARNLELPWPPEYDEASDSLENDPEFPICSWAIAQKL
ncbi:methyltransferase domain-containing protein [Pseudooceanicola sp.]|uniref:methyltransferase domain-containing protein n=1 Tax=Pseudooceanicola sp. TaxID=1914328 RepID=UPI0040583A33